MSDVWPLIHTLLVQFAPRIAEAEAATTYDERIAIINGVSAHIAGKVDERIAALQPPQGDGLAELRVGNFVMRTSPNGIWIGRTDGEGGEFATEHVERVIAQFYREQF